jgi:hypothetical protein
VLVPHAVPVVLREHACVSLEVVPAHVALLVQAYAVTVRDWLPVSSHVSPKPPQLPQAPDVGAAHVVPTALLLQLLVETAGLHSWQATPGLVAPAAWYAPPIQQPLRHWPVALHTWPAPQPVPPAFSG